MQDNKTLSTLSASLAALSVHPHPTTTTSPSTCHHKEHKPPSFSHSHQTSALHPSSPSPSTAPAPISLPTFTPLSPTTSTRDCLRHFLTVQEHRALTYSAWASAFRHYLANKQETDLHAFTQHCQHTTAAFQQLSLQVKLCIAHLQSIHSAQWAEQLQAVQRLEREKLGLTVAMQEVTSEWVVVRKEEFSSELQAQLLVRRERMDEVVEEINDIMAEVRYEVNYKRKQ